MTKMTDEKNAVVLEEDALENVNGGPAYIKFDGIDGESFAVKTTKTRLTFGQTGGRARR